MVGQDIRVGDPAAGFGAEDACRGQATAAFTGADGDTEAAASFERSVAAWRVTCSATGSAPLLRSISCHSASDFWIGKFMMSN